MRVFIDASVLVAAALSSKGGSFRVISESALHGFTLIMSPYAHREAEAALEEKYERYLSELSHLAASVSFVADAPASEIKRLRAVIAEKDAPVFAAARHGRTDVILTLDRKHFLDNATLRRRFPYPVIMTPGVFVQMYFV